ncbi:hypothetical protein BBJ28_00018960 [Nothophytophthora sp. Chile5]|nr:hypothetical protein BBJ28_00018960 [Nothophytophthora sp. Chile5]
MSSWSSDAESSSIEDITFPPNEDSVPSGTTSTTSTALNLASTGETDGGGDATSNQSGHPPSSGEGYDESESQRADHDNYKRTHGSCMYYPTDDHHPCQVQRSCYDCLNFNITTEPEGCYVNSMGQCVSATSYDPNMDFELGEPSNQDVDYAYGTNNATSAAEGGNSTGNGDQNAAADTENQQYDFLASKATYCEQDDAQCLLCQSTAFAEIIYHNSDVSRSRFCYGENGCVCVAICEALSINRPKLDKSCMVNTMSTQQDKSTNQVGSIAAILGAMCFVVASVFVIYRIRTRGERASHGDTEGSSSNASGGHRRVSDDGNPIITPESGASPIATATPVMRTGSGSGLLLNLFGWTAMREVLIQKEQLQASGVDDAALSPVKHSNVQFLGTHPSAPDVDAATPTAPPVIPYATLAMASAPVVMSIRAMAAPSAPDFEDMDSLDGDVVDMAEL